MKDKREKPKAIPLNEEMSAIENSVDKDVMKNAQIAYQAAEMEDAKPKVEVEKAKYDKENDEYLSVSQERKLWGLVVFLLILFFAITALTVGCNKATEITAIDPVDNEKIVADNLALLENGGAKEGEDYEFVDSSKNPATAGASSFNKAGVNSPAEMVAWLEKQSDGAKALIGFISEKTGASESQILNVSNWLAVKAERDFVYPGNTSFQGGKVVSSGNRAGVAGEIFLVFINPENSKLVYVRAACANPQGFTPYLTPKSSNPADYKQPGDDSTTDSGQGTKPPAVVTTKPEAKPPVVVTDNSKPGTDPGTVAPGAPRAGPTARRARCP